MPKTLFIDADACPVTRESIDCARRAGVAVVIAGNSTQNLERHIRRDDPRDAEHARRGFWVTTLDVSVGADSADFMLVNLVHRGDLVVTQDYGLAAMCLARGAFVINQDGMPYDDQNIDALLLARHTAKKIRMSGGRLKGPKKRTPEQNTQFRETLVRMLSEAGFSP